MTIKKNALLAAILGLMSAPALAHNAFAGPYVGASLGFFQGNATSTEYSGDWDYGEYTMNGDIDLSYGLQAGFNVGIGNSGIAGIELSYSAPQFEEKRTFNTTYINAAEWKSVISLSAKGGVVVDKTLLYVKAGLSQVDAEYGFGDSALPADFTAASEDVMGLSVGAGVEFALSDQLSVRGEYSSLDLESVDIGDFGGSPGSFQSSGNSFTVGVNFNF
ncbi:MAG: porin family protein [Pseudomonadota bacterium]